MPVFTVHQAQTQLSKLLAQVRQGEDVVITRGKEAVARIVPFEAAKPRRPGSLKGRVALTPDFFDPRPPDEVAAWGDHRGSCSTPMP